MSLKKHKDQFRTEEAQIKTSKVHALKKGTGEENDKQIHAITSTS